MKYGIITVLNEPNNLGIEQKALKKIAATEGRSDVVETDNLRPERTDWKFTPRSIGLIVRWYYADVVNPVFSFPFVNKGFYK